MCIRDSYYLGTGNKGLPEGWFLGAVVVRDVLVVALCVLVVREILLPSRDRVRAALVPRGRHDPGVVDDPVGGALDGAPDRIVVPGFTRWRHTGTEVHREPLASRR